MADVIASKIETLEDTFVSLGHAVQKQVETDFGILDLIAWTNDARYGPVPTSERYLLAQPHKVLPKTLADYAAQCHKHINITNPPLERGLFPFRMRTAFIAPIFLCSNADAARRLADQHDWSGYKYTHATQGQFVFPVILDIEGENWYFDRHTRLYAGIEFVDARRRIGKILTSITTHREKSPVKAAMG